MGEVEIADNIRIAHDERHRLALEARFDFGKRWLIGERRDDAEAVLAGNVGGGEDAHDALVAGNERGKIAETELRTMMRAADRAGQKRTVRPMIGAEYLTARHLHPSVEALNASANRRASLRQLRRRVGHGRRHHRIDDLAVTRAAAEHSAERIAGLLLAGAWVALQKLRAGDEHARRTDTALGGAVAEEARLQGRTMCRAVAEALHSHDFAAGDLARRDKAGAHRHAIEEDGAGPAIARIASDFRAAQVQPLAQNQRQSVREPCIGRDGPAVEAEGERLRRPGRKILHRSALSRELSDGAPHER